MISFRCDYEEGACPEVLERLVRTNLERTPGYGEDEYSRRAAEKIRTLCRCENAEVFFTVGGTPTNAMTIAHLLRPFEAAISAETGHINVHETGAVEACGHKVVTCQGKDGKLSAGGDPSGGAFASRLPYGQACAGIPLSAHKELGTLYTLSELKAIRAVCDKMGLLLYCDGARLASALTAKGNDVFLPDLARLCDAFYIGGTKCGALFGEALVFCKPELARNFAYTRKQRGGLLAKGRLLGVQFDALMENGVYEKVGAYENEMADRLREGIRAAGYPFYCETTTNQLFPVLPNAVIDRLEKDFGFYRQNRVDEGHQAIRLVTSWNTQKEEADALIRALKE